MEIRKDIITRIGIIYFLIVVLGVVISGGILKIQNVNTEQWKETVRKIKENTVEIPAVRGNICADDGSILATSIPDYTIRLDLNAPKVREVFEKKADQLANEISVFFNVPKSQFLGRLTKAFNDESRKVRGWFLVDDKHLNYNELQDFKKLSSMSSRFFGSGLIVVTENKRILPHDDLASRTIGSLNKGVFGGIHGDVGYTGVEGMEESYLAGESGISLKKNFSGRWIEMPVKEPHDGNDVITTLNVNLQDYAQNALMDQMEKSQAIWGTAVVMEVATGDIKAIANLGRRKDGTYSETYNYALGHAGCSEPGSTFKLVSLMIAMDHGYVDTCDVFDTGNGEWEYRGQKLYDSDYHHGGHGALTMKQIFELSSNVGTAKIITQFYTGKEKEFIDCIYKFGLNKPLGLGIMGEGIPSIKYPGDSDWWGPSLAWISYGYEIKVTPLQTLTFYNAVANNGKMVKPRFVTEIRENGILQKSFRTEIINPSICSRQTLKKAQDMLCGVVLRGTGRSLQSPYYTLAGKTGTAVIAYENEGYKKGGRKNYQASFAGYFPAENPKYSCIVVIVGPQGAYYGGSVAGPVFKAIADKVYATFLDPRDSVPKHPVPAPVARPGYTDELICVAGELPLNVVPAKPKSELVLANAEGNKLNLDELNIQEKTVPDIIGMGASDVLYLLENMGLKVQMNGMGSVVRQSIPAGSAIEEGETIVLDMAVLSDLQHSGLTDSLGNILPDSLRVQKTLQKINVPVAQEKNIIAIPEKKVTPAPAKKTVPPANKKIANTAKPVSKSVKGLAKKTKPVSKKLNRKKA